jgi:hypothetical protein
VDIDGADYRKRPVQRCKQKKTASPLVKDPGVQEKKGADLADLVTPVIRNCQSDRAAKLNSVTVFRSRPARPDV